MMSHFKHSQISVDSTYWPFGVDETIFSSCENKTDKIIFMGSRRAPEYHIRATAYGLLSSAGLLQNSGILDVNAYANIINKYSGMLTCSSTWHFAMAKLFEGMLSGTAMLSNRFNGCDELFFGKKVWYEYNDDCSNIIDVANDLLNDKDKRKHITDTARKICLEHHTHTHRLIELKNIITEFISTGNIIRKWGN